ncbi:MAG: CRISPR-associated protein Csx15 [Actinomycetota bacterium]
MILVNFAHHPFAGEQLLRLEQLAGEPIDRVLSAGGHFDPEAPIAPQAVGLIGKVDLTPDEWQTLPLLVNPPGHSTLAAVVLAELHGRAGYFPRVLRMKPATGGGPPFEPAEIINLQTVRDDARRQR